MYEVELNDSGAVVLPAIWWPVTIKVPQDGGTVASHEVEVLYQLGTDEDLVALARMSEANARKKIVNLIKDWKGFYDQHKNPIPCNEQTKSALLKISFISIPVITGWRGACIGAERKNS